MEGMRHVLVHDYYRISPKKLWDTIERDIPTSCRNDQTLDLTTIGSFAHT